MSITAAVGKPFVVEVAANPTTGYVWEADAPARYARLVRSEIVGLNEAAIGGGGQERFTFEALKRGKFKIRLALRRPWEKEPIRTEHFQVEVR